MRSHRLFKPLVVTASAAAVALVGAGPASAHTAAASSPTVTVVNSTVVDPFHLSTDGGRLLVTNGDHVSRLESDGSLTDVATGPVPGDVEGVAVGGGAIAYTSTSFADGAQSLTIHRAGSPDVTADISGFEHANNPDQHVTYGVLQKVNACARKALTAATGSVRYKGVEDSHAYSVGYAGNGWWYVGDAAGNDILKVSPTGDVSLVKVLPPQPLKLTQAFADANGLPHCVVGLTYRFEPVPTNVDVFGGRVYISTLPGGPEDPSAGARGSVYRMGPNGNGLTRLATGFAGATDVAVGPAGKVYVAELFAGQISTITNGHAVPLVSVPGVVSVSYGLGALYAGTMGPSDDEGNPTGPGSIVRIG